MGLLCSKCFKSKSEDRTKLLTILDKIEKNENQGSNEIKEIILNNEFLVHKIEGTPLEKYELIKNIGLGSYGQIYIIKHKETNGIRAMKEIEVGKSTTIKSVQNEIDILKKLDHPNIVKIYEYYNTDNKFYLITDYYKEGDLHTYLKKEKTLSEGHIASIITQILRAILYCNSKKVIHCDIKPENILLDGKDENGHISIKIIDFGAAKIFDKQKKLSKVDGTCFYVAPEVINKNYDEKCDIWSIGVLLYILVTGNFPFEGKTQSEIFNSIKKDKINFDHHRFQIMSEEILEFIEMCIDRNTQTRFSAIEALNSAWIKKFRVEKYVSNGKAKIFLKNLTNYHPINRFHKLVIAIVVHIIPHNNHIREIEQLFRFFDQDQDGKLTREEFNNGLNDLKYIETGEKKEFNSIFDNLDNDGDGYIEYEEFIRGAIDKEIILEDSYLKHAFCFFNVNGNGKFSKTEFQNLLFSNKNFSQNLFDEIMNEVDLNHDNEISYDEFKLFMKKLIL